MRKRTLALIALVVLATFLAIASTQVTILSIQPIGALPKGSTVIMKRTGRMNFIDSPDAICLRAQGAVNLLCRGATMAKLADNPIYLRLPYQAWLYRISTDGKEFDR